MQKDIPFYANTPDETHCFQAVLRMVLGYFEPEKEYSFEELDKLTGKVEGLWTWPQQGLICFHERGYIVKEIDDYDAHAFLQEGEDYLLRFYGADAAKEMIAHSDIKHEQEVHKKYVRANIHEKRIPNFEDIQTLLNQDFLVCCLINSKALHKKPGHVGHFVLIYHCDEQTIHFHNPGLPPQPNQIISHDDFEAAWASPNEGARNIMAFKK